MQMQPHEIQEQQFNAEELSTIRLALILSLNSNEDVVHGYMPKSERIMKELFTKLDTLQHAFGCKHCSNQNQNENEKVNHA
ncbi:MAG: hypothetical protein ACR2IS_19605 [Nitrososphaeraceae archaeon]